jgi:protein-ribulosamine 3-kinase
MNSKFALLDSIQNGLSEALGKVHALKWARDLSGGDINRAALLQSGNDKWFLKYRFNAPPGMFEAEALALREISASGCIRAPSAIAHGSVDGTAWLVLEYLELLPGGPASLLGEQLAALHRVTGNHYGWSINNYIGTTPQHNRAYDNWMEFWRDCRLQPQLEMAANAGFGGRLIDRGERLLASLDQLLQGHHPVASLLHGDLWAGNMAYTPAGQPVIFDPASYYGDREADLAMTELFGGFEPAFYSAYRSQLPLDDGYPLRRELYNLYHILNHLNLFGSGYLARSEHVIDGLLAQIN